METNKIHWGDIGVVEKATKVHWGDIAPQNQKRNPRKGRTRPPQKASEGPHIISTMHVIPFLHLELPWT